MKRRNRRLSMDVLDQRLLLTGMDIADVDQLLRQEDGALLVNRTGRISPDVNEAVALAPAEPPLTQMEIGLPPAENVEFLLSLEITPPPSADAGDVTDWDATTFVSLGGNG